jgi:glutamate/tyrosine decarboxylase-like PLP-dependent enzyme
MTAHMLGGDSDTCGTVTSGGSESIHLAMKTYRDWGRKEKGIRKPEIVLPDSAHVAFDKAGDYFSIKIMIQALQLI